MLSTEGFEVVKSVVCFLFQFINVFCPGHVVLKGHSEEDCFFTERDLLIVE